MLTHRQYARLPGTAQAIVETDRQIAALTDRVVTPFGRGERADLRALINDRRVLTTRAHETWGKPLRSNGTAKT